jgi:hypothetical protein
VFYCLWVQVGSIINFQHRGNPSSLFFFFPFVVFLLGVGGLHLYHNPTLKEVWGRHSHSRKWDLRVFWDSQKLRMRLQGSKHLASKCSLYHWKSLKCRYPKWPYMSHLDICSTCYGWKKGRESNWQFNSRPLKVGNQPDPDVCNRWSATHRWKALNKVALDLVPIGGRNKKLWTPKVPGVQTGTVSGLHFGSPGTKSHLSVCMVE